MDRSGGLCRGIERGLREAICCGRLARGAILPSSRSLARDLGVARGTISAAYGQLAAEGYLDVRQGTPARVRWLPRPRPSVADSPESAAQPRWDFRPGRPESASFPRQAWARAHRQVMSHAPDDVFGYGDVRGSAELRDALADYLGRARGVDTDPARLLVCNGFTQALNLICCALRAAGAATLAVENPGARRYRRLAEAAGLHVVAVPCDQDGLRIDCLSRSGASAVLVTPALGTPATRRRDLVRAGRPAPPRRGPARKRPRRIRPKRAIPAPALPRLPRRPHQGHPPPRQRMAHLPPPSPHHLTSRTDGIRMHAEPFASVRGRDPGL
jgi:GntR family transcriptional regulator/MocR family aminotransferase